MKKIIFTVFAMCIFSQSTFAFLYSDDFNNKLSTCTPIDNTNKFTTDGTIYGIENQKCHVKFGGYITNDKTGEKINTDNCYIPTSSLNRFATLSKKTANLFNKYINASSIPDAEKREFENILDQLFSIYKQYCKQ